MKPFSASAVIRLWEVGQRLHPLERSLALLAAALPDRTLQQLALLPIGQRDQLLLQLRHSIFGSQLQNRVVCPHCGESLEFTLTTEGLSQNIIASGIEDDDEVGTFTQKVDAFDCRFRLPNSQDLALTATCSTVDAARLALLQRCVLEIQQEDEPVALESLLTDIQCRLATHIAEQDPLAETLLDLVCPACSHPWQVVFEIGEFFWRELEALARRLLQEVHLLARVYGWREADILAMSAVRRQFYLERVV